MNIGKNSTSSNSNSSKKFVQFLVVLNGKSDVPGDDTRLLVVTSGISGELKNLSSEIFENGGKINGCSSSETTV